MANTTFVDSQTPVVAAWLNDVNDFVYSYIPPAGSRPQGQVTATADGSFNDLYFRVENGGISKIESVSAAILGDLHYGQHDERVIEKTLEMFQDLKPENVVLKHYPGSQVPYDTSTEEYKDYIKIICTKEPAYFGEEWLNSTNFMENIQHIMEAEIFVGGDTGTTHFAFALDNGPKELIYYGSSRALVHTLPFYLLKGKGCFYHYWLDFEGSKWNN